MKTFTLEWLGIIAISFALSASYLLDGPTDHQSEWDQSKALKELQASQAKTQRFDAAAQALCIEQLGAGAIVLMTIDGDVVCRARGVRVAGGGL